MSPGGSIADQRPELEQIFRARDFQRVITPFVGPTLPAVVLFDYDGGRHAGAVADPAHPAAAWEQIPPEAAAGMGQESPVVVGALRCLVRPAYAGAERVGTCVYVLAENFDDSGSRPLAEAVHGVVAQLLQSGFAAWVTSELHLAASEDAYRAMEQQNAELRRAVAHLRELDELKANFLATISHELRTPLTSVIGFSQMLLDGTAGPLDETQREYVQTIHDRGEDLLGLISQLLEMSRVEVGAMRLDLAPVEVADLVDRALGTLQPEIERSKVVVRSEVRPESVPKVLADSARIGQVLLNIIGNALKFTPAGGRVTIRAATAPIRRPFEEEDIFGEEAPDAVRVSIEDTGEGIDPRVVERIFDRFYQVDSGPTRRHGGAGLGLAIARSLVVAHGGEIWAESEPGKGTTLHFTLPLASRDAAETADSRGG